MLRQLALILCLLVAILPGACNAQAGAEALLQERLSLCKDSTCKVEALTRLSEYFSDINPALAEDYALWSLRLARTCSPGKNRTKAMLALTHAYWNRGKYAEAFYYIDTLALLGNSTSDSTVASDINFITGRRNQYNARYATALEHYFKALAFCERTGDRVRMGELYNTIGGVYLNQGDGKTAYDYYKKSLRIQLLKGNTLRIGRGYLNTGNAYVVQKNMQAARFALDSALYYYNILSSTEGKSYVYATFADIYEVYRQPDSSLKYLLLARNAMHSINKLYGVAQVDRSIATIYFNNGDYETSMAYVNEGLRSARNTSQNYDLFPLYLLRSQLFEKKGKVKEAFENYKLYKLISDSVLNAASIKKQAEDALSYEYNKKQYEQKLALEKEELTRAEMDKRQRLVLYAVFAGIAAILLVMYYRYRLKQKANLSLSLAYKALEQKNLIIEDNTKKLRDSLGERELLLKEIHHRVKNNLQVISGLLELQKEELTEAQSKAAFDEGQSRVRSISLIHQNLYQNENLGSIQFKIFVNDLAMQVKDVFEQPGSEMDISIEMPCNVVDIDTAVPLGLIINELLTNSYKYATAKGGSGRICITLSDNDNGHYVLTYADNGPGIKAGVDFDNAPSLGLRLIRGLAVQMAGKAEYSYNKGAVFTIIFKDAMARRQE